jgi:hypothetical protein
MNRNLNTNNRKLLMPDESTLSKLVTARLDLPISQRLLDQNFELSVIRKCWKDQLRLKRELRSNKFSLRKFDLIFAYLYRR